MSSRSINAHLSSRVFDDHLTNRNIVNRQMQLKSSVEKLNNMNFAVVSVDTSSYNSKLDRKAGKKDEIQLAKSISNDSSSLSIRVKKVKMCENINESDDEVNDSD